jgi:hypothetical protein
MTKRKVKRVPKVKAVNLNAPIFGDAEERRCRRVEEGWREQLLRKITRYELWQSIEARANPVCYMRVEALFEGKPVLGVGVTVKEAERALWDSLPPRPKRYDEVEVSITHSVRGDWTLAYLYSDIGVWSCEGPGVWDQVLKLLKCYKRQISGPSGHQGA